MLCTVIVNHLPAGSAVGGCGLLVTQHLHGRFLIASRWPTPLPQYKQCIPPSQACTQPVTPKILKAVIDKAMTKDHCIVTESITVYVSIMCLKDCSQNTSTLLPASLQASLQQNTVLHTSLFQGPGLITEKDHSLKSLKFHRAEKTQAAGSQTSSNCSCTQRLHPGSSTHCTKQGPSQHNTLQTCCLAHQCSHWQFKSKFPGISSRDFCH